MKSIFVKELSILLREIASKHHGGFYCLNYLHSFAAKKTLNRMKRYVNKDFCNVIIPSEDTKILGFNQYQKSDKVQFIIYADLESIIEKIDGCKNNPENSSSTKASEHILNACNIFISSFRSMENKRDVCRGKY